MSGPFSEIQNLNVSNRITNKSLKGRNTVNSKAHVGQNTDTDAFKQAARDLKK
jgi:hypothetical protein